MDNEKKGGQSHELRLENRQKLTVTGVQEVESFDEAAVILHTVAGLLRIHGEGLQLQSLSIDGGQVAVHGTVDSLSYEAEQKGGFFRRLLG